MTNLLVYFLDQCVYYLEFCCKHLLYDFWFRATMVSLTWCNYVAFSVMSLAFSFCLLSPRLASLCCVCSCVTDPHSQIWAIFWCDMCVLWRGIFQFSISPESWDASECTAWPHSTWRTFLATAGNYIGPMIAGTDVIKLCSLPVVPDMTWKSARLVMSLMCDYLNYCQDFVVRWC